MRATIIRDNKKNSKLNLFEKLKLNNPNPIPMIGAGNVKNVQNKIPSLIGQVIVLSKLKKDIINGMSKNDNDINPNVL